jgi:hypothetical protein
MTVEVPKKGKSKGKGRVATHKKSAKASKMQTSSRKAAGKYIPVSFAFLIHQESLVVTLANFYK